jgi:hypothetical protein
MSDSKGWAIDMRCGTRAAYRLVIGLTLTLVCARSDVAVAGTYVMRSCNVPGHRSAPAAPWVWLHTVNTYANDECASGGGFGLNAGAMQRVTAAAVVLERPREGPQNVITIRRVRLWLVARLSSTGSSLFVAASAGGNTGALTENIFGPPGGDTLTSPYVSPVLLADTGSYVLFLSCSGNTWDGCVPGSPNPLEVRGAEVTLQEDVAPTGSVDGGSLLDGGAQSGIRSINYALSDQESGVAEVSAVLGSTVVATQDFKPECAYSSFAACPQARSGPLMIDTRKVPDGSYPLSIRVTDAAGNRETIQAQHTVQVSNGLVSLVPNGLGATGDAKLTAAFVGRRGSTVTVPYTRRVVVRGRLTTSSGKPIARAGVEVTEAPVRAGARVVTRTALTRSNGAYSYVIRRNNGSRVLQFRYSPNLGDESVAAAIRLRMNVAASATLRVAIRGVRVTYRGRVLTRPMPVRGKLIYVEGRAKGGAWTRFAVRRSSRSGLFSGRYRLRVRRPGIRLQFRVRIPKEAGYPYVASVGRAVTRAVR